MIWWVVQSFTFPPTPFLRPNQETFSLPGWVLVFIQIHWIALNHIKGQQFTRAKVRIGMPEKCWRNLEEMLETCRRRILGTLWLVALCEIPTHATQQQKETFSLKPIPISNVVTIRRHFLMYSSRMFKTYKWEAVWKSEKWKYLFLKRCMGVLGGPRGRSGKGRQEAGDSLHLRKNNKLLWLCQVQIL